MIQPLVSVVIPCYNNASFVTASVNSVLSQDYPNIEVIVVDDGSRDNSVEVLEQFGDKIRLIQQPNQGPAAARNTGLQAAQGHYIAFNDSDDFWLPGKLTAQVAHLEQHPDIGLCFCRWAVWQQDIPFADMVQRYAADSASTDADPHYSGWLYIPLLKESVIHTITAVVRRDVLLDVGFFNADYRIGEDYDLWIRISRKYPMTKLNQVFALYRDNPDSITKGVQSRNFSAIVLQSAIDNYGLTCPSGQHIAQSTVNQYLGARHFSYGYNAMIKNHRKKALTSFKACIGLRYRLAKALCFYLVCALPPLYKLVQHVKKPTASASA